MSVIDDRRNLQTSRRNGQPANPPPGRVSPNNLQAEESLLGAMLLSRDAIAIVADIGLTAEDFYKPVHGHIYEAISTIYERGEPPDAVIVAEVLRRDGLLDAVGGVSTLINLQAATPATTNAARYARIVEHHSYLRRLISVAGEIAEIGYDQPDDLDAALERAENLIYKVGDRRQRNTSDGLDADTAIRAFLDRLETRYEHGSAISGIPTGFHDLDEMLLGLHPGELITVGARPAMGKTSFGLDLAAHAAGGGHPVAVFSIEMSADEITDRIVSAAAKVDGQRIRSGRLVDQDWHRINTHVGPVADWPFWIYDDPYTTVPMIRSKLRRLSSRIRRPLGLVIVDYLQLLTPAERSENRQVDVSEFADGLKRVAREFDAPVVALAQLSRNLEYRADKRPVLADLRESGTIEQSSNVVLMLYRDEVYHPDSADRGAAEVIVAKQRNGPTGTVNLAWLPQFTRFSNMARGAPPAAPKEAS